MTQDVEQDIREARRRIEEIRERIAEMDLVSSGTLLTRKKTCGKKSCRCSVDVEAHSVKPFSEFVL